MEAVKRIHFLHLNDGLLRWATVEREGKGARMAGQGRLEGAELLEKWARDHLAEGESVRLYDGRPRYYCLDLKLPAKTPRRQQQSAIELRVRQELGAGAERLAWATRASRGKNAQGAAVVELFTVVARRDGLEGLEQWGTAHAAAGFWVGADVDAVRCLALGNATGTTGTTDATDATKGPVVFVNREPGEEAGAAVYRVAADGMITKTPLERAVEGNGASAAGLTVEGTHEPVRRAVFGGRESAEWLRRRWPGMAEAPEVEIAPEATGGIEIEGLEVMWRGSERGDAVLIGGLLDWARQQKAAGVSLGSMSFGGQGEGLGRMPSLVGGADEEARGAPEAVRELEGRLPSAGRLGVAAAAALAALVCCVGFYWVSKSGAADELAAHAKSLQERTAFLQAQRGVLARVRAERAPLIPLFEGLHEAIPKNVELESITVREGGTLELKGTAKGRDAAGEFQNALAGLAFLSDVQTPQLDAGKGNKTPFQITAKIKDRVKR